MVSNVCFVCLTQVQATVAEIDKPKWWEKNATNMVEFYTRIFGSSKSCWR